MRVQKCFVLVLAAVCLFLSACGEGEVRRPVDYPDTIWTCEAASIQFTVSDSGITEATLKTQNGEEFSVIVEFSDISEKKITVFDADGKDKLFGGNCTFGEDEFSVQITDYYSADYDYLPITMEFIRSDA